MAYFGILIALAAIMSLIYLDSIYLLLNNAYGLVNAAAYDALIAKTDQLQLVGCSTMQYGHMADNGVYISGVDNFSYVVLNCT